MSTNANGTQGFAKNAPLLIEQWQGITFTEHDQPIMHQAVIGQFLSIDRAGSIIDNRAVHLAIRAVSLRPA